MKDLRLDQFTPRERLAITQYLRAMAGDTQLLLRLADASLCSDVAAVLRGRAQALEQPALPDAGLQPAGLRMDQPLYSRL